MATLPRLPPGRARPKITFTRPNAAKLAPWKPNTNNGWVIGPPAPAAPAAAAAAPAAPAAPAPAAPAPATPPSPLDSQYSNDVAGLLFNNKNQRADIATQGGQDTQDFNTMLERMAQDRAQSLMAQNYGANNEGLFYSGQLGKRRDQTNKGYDQKQGDQQTAYDRRVTARNQALDRLGTITADPNSPTGYSGTGEAGLGLGNFYTAAVGRRAILDQSLVPNVAPDAAPADAAPEAAAAPAASGGQIKIAKSAAHGGARWVYHLGASGKWIPVRPA